MRTESFTLDVSAIGGLSDDEFFRLASSNKTLKLERNARGEIIIMALTGGKTGIRNSLLTALLTLWNRGRRLGVTFDSSTGFKLPDGSIRSPDAAFVARERWAVLGADEQSGLPPLCPDFVIELMSASDAIAPAQAKMGEWIANGCRLAWLLDAERGRAYVYRAGGAGAEERPFDAALGGEGVLPGFELNLAELND